MGGLQIRPVLTGEARTGPNSHQRAFFGTLPPLHKLLHTPDMNRVLPHVRLHAILKTLGSDFGVRPSSWIAAYLYLCILIYLLVHFLFYITLINLSHLLVCTYLYLYIDTHMYIHICTYLSLYLAWPRLKSTLRTVMRADLSPCCMRP